MLKGKKLKKKSPNTMKVIFLGWMYHCKKCNKTRGIIKHNHKDYSHKKYQELSNKYAKQLKCIERGITLLSSFASKDIICPKCRRRSIKAY